MAHLCIKYRLNPDGSVPEFLCLHPDGVGGVYGVVTPGGTTQHDDTVFVGLSEDENAGPAEVVNSQTDLETYLYAIGADWTQPDPDNPDASIPFDAPSAAAWVWGRLESLNAA